MEGVGRAMAAWGAEQHRRPDTRSANRAVSWCGGGGGGVRAGGGQM